MFMLKLENRRTNMHISGERIKNIENVKNEPL